MNIQNDVTSPLSFGAGNMSQENIKSPKTMNN